MLTPARSRNIHQVEEAWAGLRAPSALLAASRGPGLTGLIAIFLLLPALAAAGAEKDPRGKLATELYGLARASERGQASASSVRSFDQATQRVVAVIELAEGADADRVARAVVAAGGELLLANMGFLKVRLPARALSEVASNEGVRLLRAPHRPTTHAAPARGLASGFAGSTTSQGRAVIHADEFTARTGADGAGVFVGILDEGFKGASALLGSELPQETLATERVRGRLGSYASEHGTACAEIVHDVAPGARLALADFEDEVEWADAVDSLLASGVQILSHSIGFDNLYPPNGNNPFAAKVDAAAAAGVLFVTAAGNEAQNYFKGAWRDTDNDEFLEYGGITEFLPIGGGSGTYVRLRWDDAYGTAVHDYDIYVVNAAFKSDPDSAFPPGDPRILGRSEDAQRSSGNPLEFVAVDSTDEVLYVVIRHDPATPSNAGQQLFLWASSGVSPDLRSGSGTLSTPADAREAVAVAAVDWKLSRARGFQLARADRRRPQQARHDRPRRRGDGLVRHAVLRDFGGHAPRRRRGRAAALAHARDEPWRAAGRARGGDHVRRLPPQQRVRRGPGRPRPRPLAWSRGGRPAPAAFWSRGAIARW